MGRVDQTIYHGADCEAEHLAYLDSLCEEPNDNRIVLKAEILALQGQPSTFIDPEAHEHMCCGCQQCSRYREVNGIERWTVSHWVAPDTRPPW